MAIRTVVTAGYGNGTFNGTIALVTTRGYIAGAALTIQIYTMNILANISPVLNITTNASPTLDIKGNPSPAREVIVG